MEKPIRIERFNPVFNGWELVQSYNDNEAEFAEQSMRGVEHMHPKSKLRLVRVLAD